MNVEILNKENALNDGAELWLIQNSPELYWWKYLNLRTHYLFAKHFSTTENVLLGTENHLQCRWVYVWNLEFPEKLSTFLNTGIYGLKAKNIRLFSNSDFIKRQLEASPMSSSLNISCIENT